MPTLTFLNQYKQKEVVDVVGNLIVGKGRECHCVLQPLKKVHDAHLLFYTKNDKRFVRALKPFKASLGRSAFDNINENEFIELKEQLIILLGDLADSESALIHYENKEYISIKELNDDYESKSKIIVKDADISIREETDQLLENFYSKLPKKITPITLSNYFCIFLTRFFPVSTAIIYKKDGKQYRNLAVKRKDASRHLPSERCFFEVAREGVAMQFNVNEQTRDIYKTIVQNEMRSTFIFPLKFYDDIFGMVYLDSKYQMPEKDFTKILKILNTGISQLFASYLIDKPESELLKYKKNIDLLCKPEKNILFGWKFLANYESSSILESVNLVEIGLNKCMLVSGLDLFQSVILRSYIKGLMDCQVFTDGRGYFPHVVKYLRKYFSVSKFRLIELSIEYPYSMGDDGIDMEELRKNKSFLVSCAGKDYFGYIKKSGKIESLELSIEALEENQLRQGDWLVFSRSNILIKKLEELTLENSEKFVMENGEIIALLRS